MDFSMKWSNNYFKVSLLIWIVSPYHYELENSKYLVPQKLSAYVEKDNLNKN